MKEKYYVYTIYFSKYFDIYLPQITKVYSTNKYIKALMYKYFKCGKYYSLILKTK